MPYTFLFEHGYMIWKDCSRKEINHTKDSLQPAVESGDQLLFLFIYFLSCVVIIIQSFAIPTSAVTLLQTLLCAFGTNRL